MLRDKNDITYSIAENIIRETVINYYKDRNISFTDLFVTNVNSVEFYFEFLIV